LGEPQSKGARILAPRLHQAHVEKAMQSNMIFPDRLLEISWSFVRLGPAVVRYCRTGHFDRTDPTDPADPGPFDRIADRTVLVPARFRDRSGPFPGPIDPDRFGLADLVGPFGPDSYHFPLAFPVFVAALR